MKYGRRIRLGMVGGGSGSFIGAVHRMAARLDDRFELVAGALSSDPETACNSAAGLGIAVDRSYASYEEMAEDESRRADGVEAVSVVTPNHLHVPVSLTFLNAGIHVICDKPLAASLDEGLRLQQVVAKSGRLFILTHNYSGYPLVRHARELFKQDVLGEIRVVQVEYAQDWLATDIEREGSKGAEWRTDPSRAGAGGAIGDIGTHAFHLLRFVTGLEVETLQAQLTSFVPGRKLDDNAEIMLRFKGGARGAIWVSQVAVGKANGLKLRVYGEKASISWTQEEPDKMHFAELGMPSQILIRGGPGLGARAAAATRIPAGHPEGYIEAFACLYRDAADLIEDARFSGTASSRPGNVPDISDGIEGLRFIDAVVRSSTHEGARVRL